MSENQIITQDGEIVETVSTTAIVPADRPRLAMSLDQLGTINRLDQVTKQSFSTKQMIGKTFTVLGFDVQEGTQYGDMVVMDCIATLQDSSGAQYALPFFVRSTSRAVREKLGECAARDAFPVEVTVAKATGAKGEYYTLQ